MQSQFNQIPARDRICGERVAAVSLAGRRDRKSLFVTIFVGLLLAAGPCAAQNKVTVGGAGSMVPVMQQLARAFEAKSGSQGIEVMTNSLGSGGGIKGVETGRLAVGLTGRALKDSEKGALVYRQLAVMPVIIGVNAGLPVSGITSAQLCAVYSGSIKSWKQLGGPDTNIVPLTRNEDDSDKEALREQVGCYKGMKESADVVVLSSGSGMTSSLAGRPAAIGLTTYEAVLKSQGRIKAIALDGVAPTTESVEAGKYRLVKDFAVVTKGEPQGVTKGFIDFAAGADGKKIMANDGLVPRR